MDMSRPVRRAFRRKRPWLHGRTKRRRSARTIARSFSDGSIICLRYCVMNSACAVCAMVDMSAYGDDMKVAEAGLEQGVVTIPAAAFGDESKGFLRISFCADEERLTEGVRRLGAALESLK